ncbi:MAG: YuiB family protein [Bacillaceae bacterium]
MVLFFVLFFGIGFLLNMLLRMTWIMAIIYPVVFIMITDQMKISDYFSDPGAAFSQVGTILTSLSTADIAICLTGFVGAILSGFGIKILRKNGYQMF